MNRNGRDPRPLIVLLLCGGLLLLITATVGPLAGERGRATDLLAEDAGPDRPADAEELAPLNLSSFTPARLQQLDGQRIRLRVVTDSGVWCVGDRDVFEAMMKDGGEDLATVWMYLNPDVEDGMTVEGRLHLVHHPTIRVGTTTMKAFTEYRLLDAVRVGQ